MRNMIRIAAAGDVHASEETRERIEAAFAAIDEDVDLVLLAGDLTTHGEVAQAEVLAAACRGLRVPVCAVLGNHDLHCGQGEEIAALLSDAGLLIRSFAQLQNVAPGFNPEQTLTLELTMSGRKYGEAAIVRETYRQLWPRLHR